MFLVQGEELVVTFKNPGLSTLWADWQSLMQPNSTQSDRFLTTVSQLLIAATMWEWSSLRIQLNLIMWSPEQRVKEQQGIRARASERGRTRLPFQERRKEGGRFGKLSLLSALSIGDIWNMITEWFNFWLSDTSSTYCT